MIMFRMIMESYAWCLYCLGRLTYGATNGGWSRQASIERFADLDTYAATVAQWVPKARSVERSATGS